MIFDGVVYDIPHKEEKTKFAKIFEIVIGACFVITGVLAIFLNF